MKLRLKREPKMNRKTAKMSKGCVDCMICDRRIFILQNS